MYGIFYTRSRYSDELVIRELEAVTARNIIKASRGHTAADYLMVGYTETLDDAEHIVDSGKLLSVIRAAQQTYNKLEVELDYLTALCTANGIDIDNEEGADDET